VLHRGFLMKESIFRKKSIDKMKAPDELNDYIRISGLGIWLFLIAILILLLAGCIWGREFLFN
ncbi:MAG: hypothetical protein Q4E54_08145, partial [Lachnospiraceae bacterium]|nr:hypothetical protein [Lachnospiraceae bacterium]